MVVLRSWLMDLYFLYSPARFRKDCPEIQEFSRHYVNLALTGQHPGTNKSEAPSESDNVFLRVLVKDTRDPEELSCQLLKILVKDLAEVLACVSSFPR